MSESTNLVPKRRFKEFIKAGAWEQRKLGEVIFELKSGLSRMLSSEDIGLPVVRANNINDGLLDMTCEVKYWYKNDPQGADTDNYLIKKDDILVNFINSEAKMGTAAIVEFEPCRDTIYTTNILRMRTNALCDIKFILALTMTDSYKMYIKGISKIAVNQASFTTGDYKNYEMKIPNIDEQKQIGTFLSNLDNLITLHQRKLEKMKLLKSAYLSEMFPAEGEREPKRRFARFTDAWEQRKFSEIFIYLQNISLSRADLNYERGFVKNVHYGDVLIKFSEVLDVEKEEIPFISNSEFNASSASLLQNGDVIIADAAEDETVGKCSEIKGVNGTRIVSGLHTIPCRPTKTFATGYLGYYMNSIAYHDQLLPLIQGTKISSISKSALQNTDIIYPDLEEEQRRIGIFFDNLDNLITLHQRKLQKLQNIKKAFLNEMFI